MRFRIGIADLAANAIIESMINGGGRALTYGEIEDYGYAVCNILLSQNDEAVLVLSRDRTERFFHDYSEYFERIEMEGEPGIALKAGKTEDDLIERFRGYLACDLLFAFVNPGAVKKLGIRT